MDSGQTGGTDSDLRTPPADLDLRRALPSGLGRTLEPQNNLLTVNPVARLAFAEFFWFPQVRAWPPLWGECDSRDPRRRCTFVTISAETLHPVSKRGLRGALTQGCVV